MARLGDGVERADRGGMLESLADLPGAAKLLRLALKVAPRHVEADAVTPDMIERPVERNVGAAGFQRDNQFDFVMHIRAFLRIGERTRGIEVAGILLEEEGGLAIGVMAHLDRMGGVIAADAIDPAHRKDAAAGDRDRRLFRRRDHEIRHEYSSL